MRTAFTGGCMDGAAAEVVSGSTFQCRASGTFYAIDDDTGLLAFTGYGPYGREFALVMKGFREDARRERALVEAATPQRCASCGRTFADLASYTVAHDAGWPGGCVPPDVAGLEQADGGVWRRIGPGR